MSIDEQVVQLEVLCQQFYQSGDPQAEKTLVAFSESAHSLPQCQLLLERSQSPYALWLAASTLTNLVTSSTSSLNTQDRLQLRNYVLQYLISRVGLSPNVIQKLVQLVSKITKHGWFDSDKSKGFLFRDITDEVHKFLRGSVTHCEIGIQILQQLVCEMNQVESMRSLTKHRKMASSFREESLYDIFTLSCTLLQQISVHDETQHTLIHWLLKLACASLSFDFIGTTTDESSDDLATVQIPTGWRPLFLDFSTLQLFFSLFHSLPTKLAATAVSCLVQLASVRRSLFNNAERACYLQQLAKGVQGILEAPQPMVDPDCYHEFCRLLVRLKSNYQLGELMKLDDYSHFLELIAKFTITSLQSWQFSANSVHYLLGLWQRMVASVPYIRSTEPHHLNTYVPEITNAYITSRLECVNEVVRDGMEDPLDDESALKQQLDQMGTIARCEYDKTCELLVTLFDQSASSYQQLLQGQSSPQPQDFALREGQLSWLVYLIGCVVGGKIVHSSTNEYDSMDGQLVCRVLQLMNLIDSNLPQHGSEHLDLAILNFFEQFRKIYVGEVLQKTSEVYQALSEQLGLKDETMVLNLFIGKIVTNLKCWTTSRSIMNRTLQLLQDLSVGYSSVRKLVKLDSVQFILDNHTPEHFPFLQIAQSVQLDLRCRTVFYCALGRLLQVDLGDDGDRFERFIAPVSMMIEQLRSLMTTPSSQQVASEEDIKRIMIGSARDLRGILLAFNSKPSYMMFFEWLYPNYMELFVQGIQLWYHDPLVSIPVLKLFSELVQNRSQRLLFDVTSPNGVLLFREASKIIVTYGDRILSLTDIPEAELYRRKLKGVAICFNILKSALCGNYINFGVLRLYGDAALDNALNVFIKLLLSLPLKNLMDYPKLSAAYYTLLEILTQDHIQFISSLEPNVIIYILSSISEGLASFDHTVCTNCCSILDHILTYLFKQLSRQKSIPLSPGPSSALLQLPKIRPETLQDMLSSILHTIMFENCRNQWSMSRPLLGLILLNEDYFKQLRDRVVSMQPPDRQNAMIMCFDNLMDGIGCNLLPHNRDKFTQNLTVFRRDVGNSLKDVTVYTTTTDMMT